MDSSDLDSYDPDSYDPDSYDPDSYDPDSYDPDYFNQQESIAAEIAESDQAESFQSDLENMISRDSAFENTSYSEIEDIINWSVHNPSSVRRVIETFDYIAEGGYSNMLEDYQLDLVSDYVDIIFDYFRLGEDYQYNSYTPDEWSKIFCVKMLESVYNHRFIYNRHEVLMRIMHDFTVDDLRHGR